MKPRIKEVIVVEGRYDKNTLSQAVDAVIIETGGFSVFSDREKAAFLRRLADERGIIVFTDSDSAGFLIRGHLKSVVGNKNLKHAYIPELPGREKRKKKASREGLLGVEGMKPEILIEALRRAGATFEDENSPPTEKGGITKADLYALGFAGGENSSARRRELSEALGLPSKMTANALLEALNVLYSKKEFYNYFKLTTK